MGGGKGISMPPSPSLSLWPQISSHLKLPVILGYFPSKFAFSSSREDYPRAPAFSLSLQTSFFPSGKDLTSYTLEELETIRTMLQSVIFSPQISHIHISSTVPPISTKWTIPTSTWRQPLTCAQDSFVIPFCFPHLGFCSCLYSSLCFFSLHSFPFPGEPPSARGLCKLTPFTVSPLPTPAQKTGTNYINWTKVSPNCPRKFPVFSTCRSYPISPSYYKCTQQRFC